MKRSLFHTKDDHTRWLVSPPPHLLPPPAARPSFPCPELLRELLASPSEMSAEDSLLPLPQSPTSPCLSSPLRRWAGEAADKQLSSGPCTSFCSHTEWMRTVKGLLKASESQLRPQTAKPCPSRDTAPPPSGAADVRFLPESCHQRPPAPHLGSFCFL